MKKLLVVLLVICLSLSFVGCWTMEHKVGNGAQSAQKIEKKQWYVLFGLIPLNNVDSQAMAAGATDYTIRTQQSFVDVVIGIFTGYVTIYPRTVRVTK